MGKTYRKEKDQYGKREAKEVVVDKEKLRERDRARRNRELRRNEHWDDDKRD